MINAIELCNEQSKKNIEPRIYVACLAAYNNGYLHGTWINAHQSTDDLYAEINKMLATSPAPYADEFAIHDHEGFGDVYIGEYTDLETITEIANFISEHYELGAAVLAHANGDAKGASRLLEECYHGEYESEKDFAESFAEDTMMIPERLSYYIDYEKMAWDLFISDFFSLSVQMKVHVFSNN